MSCTAARFGVGIETSTGGTVTVDAGSAALPRLVSFQWTPLAPGRPGSLENLCNAAGGPITDPAEVVFGWLYEVVATARDGRVISVTHECVPFPDPNDRSTPPPPPDLVAPTVGDVWRAVALPRPVVGANPVSRGVTGLDTWLWSGGPTGRAGRGDDRRVPDHRHRARRRIPLRDRRGVPRRDGRARRRRASGRDPPLRAQGRAHAVGLDRCGARP